jgi:hypothetical protein
MFAGLFDRLRRRPKPPPAARSSPTKPAAPGHTSPGPSAIVVEYNPSLDGDADPGEVVWTWVTYEDDPSQGKDRPVVVIGHRGSQLVAVALTSKQHDNEPQVQVGSGPWDREGRPSYAKVGRLLDIDPHRVRREGAILDRVHFDAVVAGARRAHGGTLA